jgi:signal transduction histidine kinase/CheY-like chemotaxis protein
MGLAAGCARRWPARRGPVLAFVLVDQVALILAVHAFGSTSSPTVLFLAFALVANVMLFGERVAALNLATSIGLYGALLLIEGHGLVGTAPYLLTSQRVRELPLMHWLVVVLSFVPIVLAMVSAQRRLVRQQESERSLRAEHDRARERALTLERQLSAAHRLEALGRLAGGVAHDFNNLLTLILGYARHVQRALPAGSPAHGDLDEVVQAAKRASALTQQLLAFGQRQRGERQPLDLGAAVKSLATTLGRMLGEDIRLQLQLTPEPLPLLADPAQIDQILLHLAVNARDAMPGGGELTIATSVQEADTVDDGAPPLPAARYAVLRVRDTGVGMDAETLDRVFEPFFTSKKRGQGTGLGLSTVHGIVEGMQGAVRVRSAPGQGSEFRVLLPLRVPVDERAATPVEGLESVALRGSEPVLVVEDDFKVRQLVTEVLGAQGYQVFQATSTEEAIELIEVRQVRPALLLTDVVLPGLSGPVLAERVRLRQADLRVLYISGHDGEMLRERGLADDTQPVLRKPFTEHQLLQQVRLLLDRAPATAG